MPAKPVNAKDEKLEWCFPVRCDRGWGEVRIRSNGEVVWTGGYEPVGWACLDGISFPTDGAVRLQVVRQDIQRIDTLDSLEGTALGGRRYLCHFTKACTAIDGILSSGMLRLSGYSALNDPWEAKDWAFTVVSPEGALGPMQAVEIGREVSALLKESSRVICFCSDGYPLQIEKDLEIPDTNGWAGAGMWAHYGEDHHGAVLIFNRRRLLENSIAALRSKGPMFFGSVLYAPPDDNAGFHALLIDQRSWASIGSRAIAALHLESHRGWLFFTKHPDWSAERECRLVLHGGKSPYEYIPVEGALVEICVGDSTAQGTTEKLVALAEQFNASVSRIVWRNGVPIRTPLPK
ncbi:MAG: DUF2971 domain-containing protein [Bryobacteraceae bacterium]